MNNHYLAIVSFMNPLVAAAITPTMFTEGDGETLDIELFSSEIVYSLGGRGIVQCYVCIIISPKL